MASTIKNTSDGITGNQTIGRPLVATGGRGSFALFAQTLETANVETIALADIEQKWSTRFNDPRYYQGDAPA